MKKPSKKHHYLPEHYLKGFTDEKGAFFVYDKKEDRIFSSSPQATFFEKNLNTVVFSKGNTSDFLETLYTHVENEIWSFFDEIRNTQSTDNISKLHKMHLYLFLLFLHWRLPSNINFAEKLSEKVFKENDILDYFFLENKSGEKVSDEGVDMIRKSEPFKKAVKLLAPFAPFYKNKNWGTTLDNWRFLYTRYSESWYFVGDNPLITEGKDDHDPVNCLNEFVLPISGRILLVNTNPPIKSGFPPDLILLVNTAIIEKSNRFIAFPREDFLRAIVERYRLYLRYKKTSLIIPELFQALKTGIDIVK